MKAQILIKTADDWFEFTKSKTGQLDFAGKWEKDVEPDVKDAQKFVSSTYFTPSYYTFIETALNFNPQVYVAKDIDISDKDTFSYLIHIGALLAAVEAKNSFIAGELYLRRRYVFEKFASLTQFILEPYCLEILFSLCYGRMQIINPDDITLLFEIVKEKLDFDSSRESLEQAYTRWFKKNSCSLTLPLVGCCFYNWEAQPYSLEKLCDNLSCEDLPGISQKIRRAKQDFYKSLETSVQAEPYNSYDKNSILVCIENPEAKLCGNPGLEKAGHLRALAAKIIREAKPKKMNYGGKLRALYGETVVVEVEI